MERAPSRKGRQYFDTSLRPAHVTFDDAQTRKRNFPWGQYMEARVDVFDPDTIYVTFGPWLVVLRGHHLDPLYAALEDRSLSRVRAHPEFNDDAGHSDDTYVSDLRFLQAPPPFSAGQMLLDL